MSRVKVQPSDVLQLVMFRESGEARSAEVVALPHKIARQIGIDEKVGDRHGIATLGAGRVNAMLLFLCVYVGDRQRQYCWHLERIFF
jgi:hypothetical protein